MAMKMLCLCRGRVNGMLSGNADDLKASGKSIQSNDPWGTPEKCQPKIFK